MQLPVIGSSGSGNKQREDSGSSEERRPLIDPHSTSQKHTEELLEEMLVNDDDRIAALVRHNLGLAPLDDNGNTHTSNINTPPYPLLLRGIFFKGDWS